MRTPCKGCPDRTATPNCHGACEKYAAFKAHRDMVREKVRENASITGYIVSSMMRKEKRK